MLSRWSHSDLIKLARVTAKNDPEKEAVLDVCVRGFEEVQKKQKGNPATTSVLDYIGKVRRLKKDKPARGKQEAWDPTEAINLIRNQSFTIDDLPSEHLNNPAIWEVTKTLRECLRKNGAHHAFTFPSGWTELVATGQSPLSSKVACSKEVSRS